MKDAMKDEMKDKMRWPNFSLDVALYTEFHITQSIAFFLTLVTYKMGLFRPECCYALLVLRPLISLFFCPQGYTPRR